ncbi:hypothetical protein ['Chrysanthemum coronarium' phytoplasma]|uniref:Uncharacterized protein n=1 Tax='Chrysanthemum coronarium' phytoplasma TaxID=1520703 RepID=A0ABQ0J3D6_9MOLU|nr:hypothetical protein ['Chrysanthemum coronarium' phytoplasma]GAK74112.1 putative uncharacterized protein ['Chrysanthemum coronarium' phytoplasma]
MNNSSKQSKPFNNLKLSKFYFLLVFSTLFFIHFFNLATQAKALEFDPEDPHLEDEAKTRKENQEVMWGPVFNTPDHTLTKWDGDFKVVKTATETPNNLLLLTSRAYDAQNNLLWGHEDTWDRTYELFRFFRHILISKLLFKAKKLIDNFISFQTKEIFF